MDEWGWNEFEMKGEFDEDAGPYEPAGSWLSWRVAEVFDDIRVSDRGGI